MKHVIAIAALSLFSFAVVAADPTPKDAVTEAAKALGAKANYSWKTVVVVPDDTPFRPGPTEGQTEKGGFTLVKMSFGDNTMEMVLKGEKAAMNNPDGGWQTAAELENSEGPGRFMGMMARSFKAPVDQAQQLVTVAQELKKDGDTYSADLTEAGVKTLMAFRMRGGDGPTITNPKGSVKFWVKDGALTKYQFKVKGTMSFNGNDRDMDRDTTVEIKEVGTTKVAVPDEAKKKLEK